MDMPPEAVGDVAEAQGAVAVETNCLAEANDCRPAQGPRHAAAG